MKWINRRPIFVPEKNHPWMQTHAANPVPVRMDGDRYRIYFSCRNAQKEASVGFVEIRLSDPTRILRISESTAYSPGEIGLFDDQGISLGTVIRSRGKYMMYYVGWNLSKSVPWRNSIGLAVSDDGEKFERVGLAPVLDRNNFDPYSLSYPCVMEENGTYRMWYGSNISWGATIEQMTHGIRHAVSEDGIHWKPHHEWSLHPNLKDENAFARPFVRKRNDVYEMWYSKRGVQYSIGYATSADGIHWERKDEIGGMNASGFGWDSDAVEYPFIIEHEDKTYLFYCGNGYGLTGFGIAELSN